MEAKASSTLLHQSPKQTLIHQPTGGEDAQAHAQAYQQQPDPAAYRLSEIHQDDKPDTASSA